MGQPQVPMGTDRKVYPIHKSANLCRYSYLFFLPRKVHVHQGFAAISIFLLKKTKSKKRVTNCFAHHKFHFFANLDVKCQTKNNLLLNQGSLTFRILGIIISHLKLFQVELIYSFIS